MAQLISSPEVTKIGTHSGTFHCDDALACFLLKQLPEYSGAEIVRSRDYSLLEKCNILVDVGGVFDPSSHRYDHHQREFKETMHSLSGGKYPWVTKLSSAGLVYFHFGHRILPILCPDLNRDEIILELIYRQLYENFVEEIDAIDNGIAQCNGIQKYAVTTTLSSRVSHLAPAWNDLNSKNFNEIFPSAMELVGKEIKDRLNGLVKVWVPARNIVANAIDNAMKIDQSGEIIYVTPFCPWKDHLEIIENERNMTGKLKYVIYNDSNFWRLQCVPINTGGFGNRLSLPEPWRGLRDEELCKIAGIDGCTFVHASGFTGGNVSQEGVVLMARKALDFGSS